MSWYPSMSPDWLTKIPAQCSGICNTLWVQIWPAGQGLTHMMYGANIPATGFSGHQGQPSTTLAVEYFMEFFSLDIVR